ncbi:MAG: hypothetical protein AB8G99_03920 [Planctomycetaceae bacterium]
MTADPTDAQVTTPRGSETNQRWIGDLWILAAITLAFLGVSRWQYSGHQRFVCVNRGQVVYTPATTKAQAIKLRDVMDQMGGFTGDRLITIKLDRVDDRHELMLITDKKQFENLPPAVAEQFKSTARRICQAAFGDTPVTVKLADPYLKPFADLLSIP